MIHFRIYSPIAIDSDEMLVAEGSNGESNVTFRFAFALAQSRFSLSHSFSPRADKPIASSIFIAEFQKHLHVFW